MDFNYNKCIVCKKNKSKGIFHFSIPNRTDGINYEAWKNVLTNVAEDVLTHPLARICSAHFHSNQLCFKGTKIQVKFGETPELDLNPVAPVAKIKSSKQAEKDVNQSDLRSKKPNTNNSEKTQDVTANENPYHQTAVTNYRKDDSDSDDLSSLINVSPMSEEKRENIKKPAVVQMEDNSFDNFLTNKVETTPPSKTVHEIMKENVFPRYVYPVLVLSEINGSLVATSANKRSHEALEDDENGIPAKQVRFESNVQQFHSNSSIPAPPAPVIQKVNWK